ncbi:MAG: hypothetical protein ACYC7G_08170 [Rudaea sp.]
MTENILDCIFEFLLPNREGWLTLKWNAWVAFGTLALALVTFAIIKETRRAEQSRRDEAEAERKRNAEYLAVIFDHELHMAEKMAAGFLKMLEQLPAAAAPDVMREFRSKLNIPFLTRFSDRLAVFDGDTAAFAAIVISRINQMKLNTVPDGPFQPGMLQKSIDGAKVEAGHIASEAKSAREVLRKHFPKNFVVVEPQSSDAPKP